MVMAQLLLCLTPAALAILGHRARGLRDALTLAALLLYLVAIGGVIFTYAGASPLRVLGSISIGALYAHQVYAFVAHMTACSRLAMATAIWRACSLVCT